MPNSLEFHSARASRMPRRAVGSLGVFYATLTGADAPTLDASNKLLALLTICAMGLSAGFGLSAWRADAAWAYDAASAFEVDPSLGAPPGGFWHNVKKWCDRLQLIAFAFGLLAGVILTLRLL
jgi:hypothetical protein